MTHLYKVSSHMLVLKQVHFKGFDKRIRSSSRSLKIMSRCSSATRSILWMRQNILAWLEFCNNEKAGQVHETPTFLNLVRYPPTATLPSMTGNNVRLYLIPCSRHRIHRSEPRHSGIYFPSVKRNIAPWRIPVRRSPISLGRDCLRNERANARHRLQ